MIEITDLQKIGIGLAGFGIALLFLGVLLLFDKGLLAIGNILFISGIGCVIGLQRTLRFFFQRHKWRATLCFFGGIIVVIFIGWPLVGMLLELYGFILLFSGFFPVAVNFIRNVPILGNFLNLPIISGIGLLETVIEAWCNEFISLSYTKIIGGTFRQVFALSFENIFH